MRSARLQALQSVIRNSIFRRFTTIAFVGLFAAGCSLAEDVTPPPGAALIVPTAAVEAVPVAAPASRPSAVAGAVVFAENCTRCHGPAGAGDGEFAAQIDTPMPDLTDGRLADERTPAQWFEIVTNGRIETLMPPWAEALSAAERWDVVAFLYTLAAPDTTMQAAADIYQLECAVCHGPTGRGEGVQASQLAEVVPDFADGAFGLERTNADFATAIRAGVGAAMPAFSDRLTETETEALADYVRALWFAPGAEAVVANGGAEAAPEAQAPAVGAGRISGKLVNRTSDTAVTAPTEVTLHIFDGFNITDTITTMSATDGSFVFNGLELVAGQTIVTTATYNSVLYNSDLLTVEDGATDLELTLSVYEATTDPGVVTVDQLHFIVQDAANSLQITEVIVFSNTSQQTLIPAAEGGVALEFALPVEAENLQFDQSFSGVVERTSTGVGLTQPVIPAAEPRQFIFSYLLAYDGSLEFDQPVTHPIGETNVVVPEGNLQLEGDNFTALGARELGDGLRFVAYRGPALAPGQRVRFALRGYSESAGLAARIPVRESGNLLVGAIGLGAVLAGVGWWWMRGRRNTSEPWRGGRPAPARAVARRDELLRSIATLDQTFEQDSLPSAEYQKQRAALKRELIAVIEEYDLEI